MTRSQQARRLRCQEYGAMRIANRCGGADEAEHPYWLRNVRIYQGIMAKAASERAHLLIAYLAERKQRVRP